MRFLTLGKSSAVAIMAAAVVFQAPFAGAAEHRDNDPIEPFAIADGLYYVGSTDIASYLFVTRDGLILIDGGLADTAPQILKNIATLGFQPRQVKILLNTHGHFDHAAGFAQLKRETGATFYASKADGDLIAHGGKGDFFLGPLYGDRPTAYEPLKPDRTLSDGEKISLGGVTLTAHITAGHTKGCTTWTFPATVAGKTEQGLILCSNSILRGYKLVNNPAYPGQAADYEKSYAFWRAAPCDLFLASHGHFIGFPEKRAALLAGKADAFVDPKGCKAFFDATYADFKAELDRQAAAAP